MLRLLFILSFSAILLSTLLSSTVGGKAVKDEKPMAGGSLSEKKEPDDKIQTLIDQLKPSIVEKVCGMGKKSGKKNSNCAKAEHKIQVDAYKTQSVAGSNYFVALTFDDKPYHARVFEQTWTNTVELTDIQGPKKKNQEIKYF